MNQKKLEDPAEVERCKAATELDEVDYLKLRLYNRNIDFFTSQLELVQLQSLEASRALMTFSNELVKRYDLSDTRQVDVHTGKIVRDMANVGTPPGSSK